MKSRKWKTENSFVRKIVRGTLFVFFFSVFSFQFSIAQEHLDLDGQTYLLERNKVAKPVSDFQSRLGFDVTKEWGDFRLGFEGELRLKNLHRMSRVVDGIYSTLHADYRPVQWFRVGMGYAFIALDHAGKKMSGERSYWDLRHRATLDFVFTARVGKWRFMFRERPQFTHRSKFFDPREKLRNEVVLRHRIKVDYEVYHLPLRPYVSVEMSNTLNAQKFVGQYVDKVRTVAGIEWRLDKRSTMDFYYRFDYGYSRDVDFKESVIFITPEVGFNHILGVFYSYSF